MPVWGGNWSKRFPGPDAPPDDGASPAHRGDPAVAGSLQTSFEKGDEPAFLVGSLQVHQLLPELHGVEETVEGLIELIADDLGIGVDPEAVQESQRAQVVLPSRVRRPRRCGYSSP